MKVMKCFLLFLGMCIGCLNFASESNIKIVGLAEYSFNEQYKIIKTDSRIYQLRTSGLSKEQNSKLSQIGSQVDLTFEPSVIASSWTFEEKESLQNINMSFWQNRSSVTDLSDVIILVGEVLPVTIEHEAMVQVGERIYRIELSGLNHESKSLLKDGNRKISISVPRKSVLSFWDVDMDWNIARVPASTANFERMNDKLRISGTVGFSFRESDLLVQSGAECVLLDKAKLTEPSKRFTLGEQVSIEVPTNQVLYTCAKN